MYYGSPAGIMSQVMVCPWQPSRSEGWCEDKLMALEWAKNDAYFSDRTAKLLFANSKQSMRKLT